MRGKWWIALLALIAFPVGFGLLTLVMEKRYTASMRLMIDQRVRGYDSGSSPFAPIEDIMNASGPRTADTTVQILTGTEVLVDAIDRTRVKFPEAFAGEKAADKYESLVRRLAVDASPLNDVIAVRVTMDDPEIAAETANQIGYAYIDYTRKMETTSGNAALAMINKQLETTKIDLAKIDAEIKAVKEQNKIADAAIAGQYTSQAYSAQQIKYSELQGNYEAAKAELVALQADIQKMPKTVKASTSTQPNPTILDLETQTARLEATLEGLRSKYYDTHPDIKALQLQIQTNKKQIGTIRAKIEASSNEVLNPNYTQTLLAISGTRARVASLGEQVAEIRNSLAEFEAKMGTLPEAERRLNELMRRRVILDANFAQLDQRREVVTSTGSGRKSPAQIVSTAIPPSLPSFPDLRLFVLIGLALGFVAAALIIMPKGDMDVYGQWPRGRAGLGAGTAPSVAGSASAPAIGEGDPDQTTS